MSKEEITIESFASLPSEIKRFLYRHGINVSRLCRETGIPRSSFYEFLDGRQAKYDLIQKVISYLKVDVSIKPAD